MQVVRIDKKGRALDHVVRLSKMDNDDLMWVALGNGGPWRITFDKGTESPFGAPTYDVPPGGFVTTTNGPKESTRVGETYRYNVKNASGEITNDPDIDIDP
jgi:hypothetical protein